MNIRLSLMRLKTPTLLYKLHRRLFAWTNGKWNDFLTSILKIIAGKTLLNNTKGILSQEPLVEILANLQDKGYYVCKTKLSPEQTSNILKFSKETPLRYLIKDGNYGKYTDHKIKYNDNQKVESPRFEFDMQEIFQCPELAKLFFDKSILNIAQEYFGSRPIADLTAFWWSKKVNRDDLQNSAAQKFHFDMDRIKFLKFFFYITDVDIETGPHCYVEGSHKFLHPQFRGRGRFEESEIAKIYGEDKIKKLTGSKGSIIIADTRGLHKGEPLVRDERLLFQIQFSNSMFGAFYPKVELNKLNQEIKEEVKKYPLVYGPIFRP